MDNQSDRKHIGALTGLRFLAALAVFLFHFGAGFAQRSGAPEFAVKLLQNGYLGVSLFFVLSGFILTYTNGQRVSSIRGYAIGRFARIYPVYLFALAFALPLVWSKLDLRTLLLDLTLTQSWKGVSDTVGQSWVMQAWTLSVEVFFYLCFPFLLAFTSRCRGFGLWVAIFITAGLIAKYGTPGVSPGTVLGDGFDLVNLLPLPIVRLPEFILGMLFAQAFQECARLEIRVSTAWADFGIVGSALLAVLILLLGNNYLHSVGMVGVLFAVVIFLIASSAGVVNSLLANRSLLLLGNASYAMYLLQSPIRDWLSFALKGNVLAQFANPILWLAISILVFKRYESPIRIRILKQWKSPVAEAAITVGMSRLQK